MPAANDSRDPIADTLRPLLSRQHARLRARYRWHGLLTLAAVLAAAVLLFFALDRWIGMPMPIRLFHTAVVLGLGLYCWQRFWRYPLQKRFADLDLAVWFERTFPDLHQRLVSAVQLQATPVDDLRNQSRAMIDQLTTDTAAAVRSLPLQRLFDPRPTRRIGLLAALGVGTLLFGAAWSPATAKAFVQRHLGIAASYPRATTLRLELPPSGPDLQRTDRGDVTELVLPAGADLHVAVLAEGVVPTEAFLQVTSSADASGERRVAMAPRPGGRFRHVFRRLGGSLEFHASGGDDDRGDRTVIVRTVSPPQVSTLTAAVQPPAYTGIGSLQQNGAIESLVGSKVELMVTTTLPVRSAVMVFLESGRRLELVAGTPPDDGSAGSRWRTAFVLEASDRYQIELLGDNGLRNPNPGTYPLIALQDHAPVGRWLLPAEEGLLPTALLCVRIEARDDFGLRHVDLIVDHAGQRGAPQPLLGAPASQGTVANPGTTADPGTVANPGTAVTSAVTTAVFELSALRAGAPAGNSGLILSAQLRDNREPEANLLELPPRIVQLVDEVQLAATIHRLFRQLREEAVTALDVQTDRTARLDDLLQPDPTDPANALTAIEVGQGRVQAAVQRLHDGLMRAFDLHLWNRLEPSQHAPRVVELYRQHAASSRQPLAHDPEFYRRLQKARQTGEIGALDQVLDPILRMFLVADELDRDSVPAVVRALTEAQIARTDTVRRAALAAAAAGQRRIEAGLRQLLLQLEDWNDIQDVIQLARALRDQQRSLQDRTADVKGKQ